MSWAVSLETKRSIQEPNLLHCNFIYKIVKLSPV